MTRASREKPSTAFRAERMLSVLVPVELGGAGAATRRRRAGRRGARAALRFHRDGLRDAPDPGRVHRSPRPLRVGARLPPRHRGARAAARIGHHRDRHRRRRALELVRGRARRQPIPAREGLARHLVRRRTPTRCSSPRAARPRARPTIRCSSSSRGRRRRSKCDPVGTRSAFAARAATGSSCAPRATSTRSFPTASARSPSQHDAADLAHRLGVGMARASRDRPSTPPARYVRAEARRKPGTTPPAAVRLAELVGTYEEFRSLVRSARLGVRDAHSTDPTSSRAWASRSA